MDLAMANAMVGTQVAKHEALESILVRYGVAVGTVVIAFTVRELLEPMLASNARYLFYIPALMVASVLLRFVRGRRT